MKHLFTLAFLLSSAQLFAQGSIQGFSISPTNPSESDYITINVDLQFNSGDCVVDGQGHTVNGFTINAYSHHCVGPLAVICPVTDAFVIGQLPVGDYTFDYTLSSGFGGPGCSAGIIPDGNDQLQFTVSPTLGIEEVSLDSDFAFPNPVSDVLYFKNGLKEIAVITNIQGLKVLEIDAGTTQIDLSNLSEGVYFLRTESKRLRFVKN